MLPGNTANPLSILIIDDNKDSQLLLRRQLESIEGWTLRIDAASTGEQALEALKPTFYDLIFLDYLLPGMDGLETLDKVRQLHPKSAVVMITAGGSEKVAVAAMKKGAIDYLSQAELVGMDLSHIFRRVIEMRYLVDQNMELRQVNQMKNEFIANVSHELRTPLSVIIGYAEALKAGTLGPLTEAQGKALDSVLTRSEDLMRTLNQILRVREAREEAPPLSLKPTDLRDFVSLHSQKPNRELKRKKMTVELSLPQEEVWVLADSEKLGVVLESVISNAVKFGPEGTAVRLSLRAEDGKALISVHDEGSGVAQEMLPRLFEQFSAAGKGPTREHPGLGLGLPLSKQIVEQHSGRIWLESKGTGLGCTAFLMLPLHTEGAVKKPGRAEKKRILIVEDNPDIVDLLMLFLSHFRENLDLATAKSGVEALEMVEDKTPRLIIMDVMMPGMDGFEVIARLRRLPDTQRIPILVLTGYSKAAEKARHSGAQDVLLKPFDRDIFIEKISRLLEEAPKRP